VKKILVVSAMAVAGAAGLANAQVDNSVQLQLRFVEITPSPAAPAGTVTRSNTANSTATVTGSGAANRTRTFELQYTMTDGSGATFPAGLVSGTLNITGATGATYSQALLTNNQARVGGTTPLWPGPGATATTQTDTSGAAAGPLAGAAGMERPYRGGFATANNNADPSNGVAGPTGILNIVPLAISQTLTSPMHNAAGAFWFAIYEFNIAFPDGFGGSTASPLQYTITAHFNPDASTQAAFGFFNDGVAVPVTSTNGTNGVVTFGVVAVPAPASVALLGLGGLVAARRRRA